MTYLLKPLLLDWLENKGVLMLAGVTYEEITDKGLVIIDKEGKRRTLEADTIITSLLVANWPAEKKTYPVPRKLEGIVHVKQDILNKKAGRFH